MTMCCHSIGSKFFLYDVGCKNECYTGSLNKALQELVESQSLEVLGAVSSCSQPGLDCLIRKGVVKETKAILPANIDPNVCLKSAACRELCRLPLDDPNAVVEEKEILDGLTLRFYFNRKHPLIWYGLSQKGKLNEEQLVLNGDAEKHLVLNGDAEKPLVLNGDAEKQLVLNGDAKMIMNGVNEKQPAKVDKGGDTEGNVLLHIRPSFSNDFPSILVPGSTPIAEIGKIDGISGELLSVFVVPYQETEECLSLLPEDTRNQLSNPVYLENAALHLALYYKAKSFHPSVDRLHGKLKEDGKAFLDYYLNHCKPEAGLAAMLQGPEAKVSPFFYSENFQLTWYKENKPKVFSKLMKAVSEEEGKQQRRITLLRDSLAWAHFYSHIRAELYVISAEHLDKEKPRVEVLNGIIIANFWRNTKCQVLITDGLPCSLDGLIQRDVRKLVFPGGTSEPIVRVGFLDTIKAVPFFTINPWSQAQCHKSKYHTVSVNTDKHLVSGLGDEPPMHLIRDELDIREGISTTNSNAILGHIAHSHRPPSNRENRETRRLETYLKLIGHTITYESYDLDDVLDCLLGPSLVHQLRNITPKDIPEGIIPILLQQKAAGKSRFFLSPTKCSASEAEVDVHISPRRPLQVGTTTVKTATFSVREARTMSVDITLKVNINSRDESFKLSKYLDPSGSCGTSVADHIYGISYKEDAWFPAKNLVVGEVLHIFIQEERALTAIQSLPLFLSFPLSRCKINHYLTSVLVDSSQALLEAHIFVNAFKLLPVTVNKRRICIEIKSLVMHIFPSRDVDQRMIQIEGNCTVNGVILMKFTCSSTPDFHKHVKFFFANSLPATEVFELFGIGVSPASLAAPISGGKLNNTIAYEGGFTLSQLLGSTEEARFTSLFFGAELSGAVEHLLPPSLRHIQHASVKAVVHFPSTVTPKLGIEATFTSKLEVPAPAEMESVKLECCLSISPSVANSSYVSKLSIRQYSDHEDLSGMSIYNVISALTGTLGKTVEDEVRMIPRIGDQILNNMSLRKIVLQLLNTEVQVFELHATLTELNIIHGKLSVNDCTLKMSYCKKSGLELECSGNLTFLGHYKYLAHFSLPTADKKGEMSFKSYKNDLVLEKVMQGFGWLSHDVESNPVMAKVLDIAVRKVAMEFSFSPGDSKLHITASEVSLFKEQLDIGLVTFHGIQLDVSTKLVKGQYVTSFSLEGYISDALRALLKYNPDSYLLTGKVSVTFSKSASAVDVLQKFAPSTCSYDNMKSILREDFMDVFKSDLRIVTQPGLMASLDVSIRLHSKQCLLQHLNLQVEDALKISCRESSYVLNTFQFEYFNKQQESSKSDVALTSHLSLSVHKLHSKENMTLDFDFTSKQDNTSFLTAKVEAGPQGGFLKLRSAIDIASAAVPGLPKFDVGLPPIFDIELLSGSVTFDLRPSFKPSSFDINILINEWRVFSDPEITVHKLTLKTTWKSGNSPQLSFTDCSLSFLQHMLNISGKLSSEEVYIECSSAEKLPDTTSTQFQSILENYTPRSEPRPILPTDIGLPPMQVELKELIIQLQKVKKMFRVNTRVLAPSPWMIKFGPHVIPVHDLGGALEWEKLENKTLYKAFLYGTIELFGMEVAMEMSLGKGIDSIVAAKISHPQCLHYGQAADHLLCSEAITPYNQYNPSNSGLSELVPSTMQDISLTSASTALNVTKRQFFLSSTVQGWGTGSLLVGYLVNKGEMDYVVSLSLDSGLKFCRLSESLAFVDQLLLLQSMNILISSTDLQNLSNLTDQFCHSFSGSQAHEKKPFYESAILGSTQLAKYGIRAGTTIYGEVNVARSHGGIKKLLELGDSSLESDISIMTYIGKSSAVRDLEIQAWIPRIKLFNMLEFSNIHLLYKVQEASEFELSGTVALGVRMNESNPLLKFYGKLSVNPAFAKFSTESCRDVVAKPCGIDIEVRKLKLALKMYLNGESPDVLVSGELRMGYIHLTCTFLLKGIAFKVFKIRLERGLTLSALFTCSAVDWPVELDLHIKEGQFYYAAARTTFDEDGEVFLYEDGYHLEAVITLLNSDFRICADIPTDRSDVVLSGRSIEPVDFFFAKITGARPYTDEGPELKYRASEKSLALTVGIEILKHPCFEGELTYKFHDKSLEGIIKYPGQFLWINEPSMTVRWSKDDGFNIVDFSLFGDVPGFSLLGAIAKFAKVIYNLVTGILRWSVKLHLKTEKNPNPHKHLVKLVLFGEFIITVIGFDIPVLPLPEVPLLLPRVDDFSFAKLPQYILKCLWDSAGPICWSLLKYLNPINLLKKSAQLIWSGIKGAVNTVVNVTKKIGQAVKNVGKKIWRGFCSLFGRSAFILDLDNGAILGYIRGGKGGHRLCDEKYIVEQFGPILTVHAIGAMAHDVHRHFKSCVDAQDDERSESSDEVDGEGEQDEKANLKAGLDELKGKAEELTENLTIEADKVLAVKEVCVEVNDKNISVEWFVYNPEEGTFYSSDKGDIIYHVKITAVVIEGRNVQQVSVYDDVFVDKVVKKTTNDKKHKDAVEVKAQDEMSSDQNTIKTSETGLPHDIVTSQDAMVDTGGREDPSNIKSTPETNPDPTAETAQNKELAKAKELGEKDIDKKEQSLNENETGVSDETQEEEDPKTCNSQEEEHSRDQKQQPVQKKRISLSIPFDPKTLVLEHTVCLCASIQPAVTLEVKMLPPDKIGSEEYKIDQRRLEEGDTSWMDDAKKEIEENGRVNEVTLQGQRMCMQHLHRPCSDAKVEFTAQCRHEEDSVTVSGDLTPVPEAECYLVQLVDGADATVIIKQSKVLPPKLHYEMRASLSDFPETSSGPYHISVLALGADLSACSVFTDSDLKIVRYCPPNSLTEALPNLDSSDSDVVRLEWKHQELRDHGGTGAAESALATETSTLQEDGVSQVEESHGAKETGDDESTLQGLSPPPRLSTESSVSDEADHFYTVTISGVCIKKPTDSIKWEAISIDNIDSSEEAFNISVPVRVDQDCREKSVGYEFSLLRVLEENQHILQGGLLFQCKVVTNGVSRLHSMPRTFADFILLAPPMDFKVTTPVRRAGLHIGWEYSAHAISYRIELVEQRTTQKAFSKILKRETGSHGESVLYRSDFKDIPCTTSSGNGYRLQMYSLGFGQELIRCLNPSVAEGILHVVPAKLQYLYDSKILRVKFRPFTNVGEEYVVALYRVTGDDMDEPLYLTSRQIYDHEVRDETVRDFPLKNWWHLLQSGDLVIAWVCSTARRGTGVTYIGAPEEEVCVMDSPDLKVSLNYCLDGTICGMKLAWSEVAKAQKYQYGYFLPDKEEYITLMETQEKEAIVNFEGSSLEQIIGDQLKVYVAALGKPGAFAAGELSLDTNTLQCIKSCSLEEHGGVIIFTSISLLQMTWGGNLANYAFSHYQITPALSPHHVLFPSGKQFPSLTIPRRFKEKFWEVEFPLFGNGKRVSPPNSVIYRGIGRNLKGGF